MPECLIHLRFLIGIGLVLLARAAPAQTISLGKPDVSAPTMAIRCQVKTLRAPDAEQVFHFYLNDARRQVLDTEGNSLGNIVQFNGQRIVVAKNNAEGGTRTFVFDRMIGALTVTSPAPAGSREPWTLSGECQKVDASRQKF